MAKPKNHLLYWIKFAFGTIGFQIHPIDWMDWKSILHLLVNIAINLTSISFYQFTDYFSHRIKPKKITLIVFLRVLSLTYIPILILWFSLYLSYECRRLNRLIIQKSFQLIYQYRFESFKVFIAFIGSVSAIIFMVYLMDHIPEIITKGIEWIFLCKTLFIYQLNILFYFPWFLLHYVKYATYQQMNQISRYSRQWRYKNRYRILQEFRNLACYNQMIAQILSPILITFFFIFIIDLLVIFYRLTTWLRNSIYLIMAIKYIVYIVYLDIQIERLFKQIINDYVVDISTSTTNVWQQNIERMESIRIKEFYYVYHEEFSLNLYHLCRIDGEFILECLLFVLSYIVIIQQTKEIDDD
ncbi:uncharacterized protein LOC142597297 isoform X3 [Dermatophagoides farinae]|uniref:uncharacterized protein LOC142597297 isoform X3 n=1 Tax=Dermatophagoides farinae TaxID=6954 RepID=UPI003F621C5D